MKKQKAEQYSTAIIGTGYLAYRDLTSLIQTYVTGYNALDYGCGRGRSSQFLASLNFKVEAVDCCSHMVSTISDKNPMIDYRHIKPFEGDFKGQHFDLVLSQLVLVEIDSLIKLRAMLKEQFEALKPGGILIQSTTSDAFLHHSWLSIDTTHPKNKKVSNGEAGKITLINRKLELDSYHWDESFLMKEFKRAGFNPLTVHQPLGEKSDPYHWVSETTVSPYRIFVLAKTNS